MPPPPKPTLPASVDLAVLGGGIQGLMLAYEAAGRGLEVLLVDRQAFNQAVSRSSLRVLHGGLRYLQSADLARFRASVQERQWFLRTFPQHTAVLPCLMPLYGRGLRRRETFFMAGLLNDAMSCRRNRGVPASHHLGPARVIGNPELIRRFPAVPRAGLRGGAAWFDGVMTDHDGLFRTLLSRAIERGVHTREHVRVEPTADGVRLHDGGVAGPVEVAAGLVIQTFPPADDSAPRSLAFNLVLDHPGLTTDGSAVAVDPPGRPTCFLHARDAVLGPGRLLAGTRHLMPADSDPAGPTPPQIEEFRRDLDAAVPGAGLGEAAVVEVLHGLLPAAGADTADAAKRVTLRPVPSPHPRHHALLAVKYTTARHVARTTLDRLLLER